MHKFIIILILLLSNTLSAHEAAVYCMDPYPNIGTLNAGFGSIDHIENLHKQYMQHPLVNDKLNLNSDIFNVEELKNTIKNNSRNNIKTLLFISADWDADGILLANSVFKNPQVSSELRKYKRININATDNNDKHIEIYKHIHAISTPIVVVYDERGELIKRSEGKCIEPENFIRWLNQ